MQIFRSFETRAYPEPWPPCRTETEFEFMAYQFQRAKPGNKSRLIEPGPNPNQFRKVFENWIFVEVT